MVQDPHDSDMDVQEFGKLLTAMIRTFLSLERNEIFCCGVTMSQCSTLLAVGKRGKMTMNELSESMTLATSTMTRVVDNLVRDGYIGRTQDDKDRRIVHVSLTGKGTGLFRQICRIYHEYHQRIVDNIPTSEVHNVVEALKLLKDAIVQTPLLDQKECSTEK